MADTKINARLHFPYSEMYTYKTVLERLNLDEERERDIRTGNGFLNSYKIEI